MCYKPLVSVIIPTYRRADMLGRAVFSVINQTYTNVEIIIVDDNEGNDRFRKGVKEMLAAEFGGVPLIYLEHSENKGLPAARNSGIKLSKGEYVAFLDDDDVWYPSKLEKQLALLESLPDAYGVVGCGWRLCHQVHDYTKLTYPSYRGDLSDKLALNHFCPPSMILVKAGLLRSIGGFDEDFRWRQDVELYYRLSKLCLFDYVDECLVDYHYHSSSMSRNFKQKLKAVDQFIEKHRITLIKNQVPWSEINERRGELAAASGELAVAIASFVVAYRYRPLRIQILGKLFLSLLGPSNYVKIRKL